MTRATDHRVTIADVARAAGVSRTTVSHVLGNAGRVAPKTREHVRRVASELGYHPNLRAQRLRTGRANAICIASSMPLAVSGGPSHLGFFMEVTAAAAEAALLEGFGLLLAPPLKKRFAVDILDVDGAVVIEPREDDPLIDRLRDRNLEIVTLGRQPGANPVPTYVELRSRKVADLLLRHLHDQGSRVLALIIGTAQRHSYVDVEAEYKAFVAARGLPEIIVRADEEGGEEAARRACHDMFAQYPEVDGICAPVDAFAMGALAALAECGRRVPEDVVIATRYDGIRARTATPPLTAIDLGLPIMAEAAVRLLMDRLAGVAREMVVAGPDPVLVPRASSARVASSG